MDLWRLYPELADFLSRLLPAYSYDGAEIDAAAEAWQNAAPRDVLARRDRFQRRRHAGHEHDGLLNVALRRARELSKRMMDALHKDEAFG